MIYTLCQSVFRTPTETTAQRNKKNLSRPPNPLPGYSGYTPNWLGALPTYMQCRIGSVCPATCAIGLFAEKRRFMRNGLTTYFISLFAPAAASQLEEQLCPSASTEADMLRLVDVGSNQC